MNSFYHAKSSARKWGGNPADYQPIHDFIDSSKRIIGDVRHRSVYHHTEGTFLCERIFGVTITNSRGVEVPTRLVAERHIIEDLGWLPTPADYIKNMELVQWMSGAKRTEVPLSHLLGEPKEPLPDEKCVTLPDGDCVGEGCMHDPIRPPASIDMELPDQELPPLARRGRDLPGFGDMILDKRR